MDFEVKTIPTTRGVIIGSGDIANVLNKRDGALIFAAGVSNSGETDELKYIYERTRLRTFIQMANALNLSLFYFSSISVNFKSTRYTAHKEEMERMIKMKCNNYNIIRIGNID